MGSQPRLIEVRKNVLKQNDLIARVLRQQFRAAGVFVVSLVSSPGSGKTMFLEKTLTLLRQNYRVAALVGDLATENDAVRLGRSQAPVWPHVRCSRRRQIIGVPARYCRSISSFPGRQPPPPGRLSKPLPRHPDCLDLRSRDNQAAANSLRQIPSAPRQ